MYLPRGVGVSICGFHPQDPGSIPGVGRDILFCNRGIFAEYFRGYGHGYYMFCLQITVNLPANIIAKILECLKSQTFIQIRGDIFPSQCTYP